MKERIERKEWENKRRERETGLKDGQVKIILQCHNFTVSHIIIIYAYMGIFVQNSKIKLGDKF